jgi:hypothetical protein
MEVGNPGLNHPANCEKVQIQRTPQGGGGFGGRGIFLSPLGGGIHYLIKVT